MGRALSPVHPDVIATLGLIKLLLSYFRATRKWVTPRRYLIGRPGRGYSVSPPSHLTDAPKMKKKKRRERESSFLLRASLDTQGEWIGVLVQVLYHCCFIEEYVRTCKLRSCLDDAQLPMRYTRCRAWELSCAELSVADSTRKR